MMMIKIYNDGDELGVAAAELFMEKAHQAVKQRGRFTVALAGGETPRRIYEILAKEPYKSRIPWQKIHIFWGDERYVPSSDIRSNQLMARQSLLDHVPIPNGQIHPITCESTPAQSAEDYEQVIRSTFIGENPQFDFIFLGLGADGHTASLFPNSEVLKERKRLVGHGYAVEQNSYRITLTAPFINQAATIVFLVIGDSKAKVLYEVLEGPKDLQRLPSQMIASPKGELHWLLDQEAGKLLPLKNK
jgi:6-phosphogluconolactonase